MSNAFDAIVIGAGLNGLVASAALGRAGLRVLLLERGPATGGEARAMQFAEGYRASPLSLDAGWLPPVVARGLGLRPELVASETSAAVLTGGGERLAIARDVERASATIRGLSARDADKWPGFVTRLGKIAGFLEALYQLPPADIDTTSLGEILPLIGVARKFRGLGREDMIELLRVLPMAVQELVDDTFESEPLKALIAAGGVQDIRQGPRSGGTSFVLLHHLVGATAGSIRGRPVVRQGPNVLANAIEDVARGAKVSIRTGTDVAQIVIRDDRVAGVALASGEEIGAPVVLSTLDPARTILGLVDSVWLDPDFLHAVRKIKFRGIRATALYAMDGLARHDGTRRRGVVYANDDGTRESVRRREVRRDVGAAARGVLGADVAVAGPGAGGEARRCRAHPVGVGQVGLVGLVGSSDLADRVTSRSRRVASRALPLACVIARYSRRATSPSDTGSPRAR